MPWFVLPCCLSRWWILLQCRRRKFHPLVGKIPWRRGCYSSIPVWRIPGQRSQVGYSPGVTKSWTRLKRRSTRACRHGLGFSSEKWERKGYSNSISLLELLCALSELIHVKLLKIVFTTQYYLNCIILAWNIVRQYILLFPSSDSHKLFFLIRNLKKLICCKVFPCFFFFWSCLYLKWREYGFLKVI